MQKSKQKQADVDPTLEMTSVNVDWEIQRSVIKRFAVPHSQYIPW